MRLQLPESVSDHGAFFIQGLLCFFPTFASLKHEEQQRLGGRVDLLFDNLPGSLPSVRAGAIRAVAVTAKTRLPALPDVPGAGAVSTMTRDPSGG